MTVTRNSTGLKFLLTRLLRGATAASPPAALLTPISTHTPLARRDQNIRKGTEEKTDFYSHASCEARQSGYLCL